MARDAGIPLRLCMLAVPGVTDAGSYAFYTDSPHASFHEFYKAPILPWARIQWFGKHCFPSPARLAEVRAMWPDFWLAPIRAPNWAGLCPTFIRTAELDPLRDEGEAYGLKLVAAGNKVTTRRYLGVPHTFMSMRFLKQKEDYDADAISALKQAHGL
jgi:acetyl esterase/lipase